MDHVVEFLNVGNELDEPTKLSRKRTLLNWLGESVCEVTFTKVDGSQRVMPCTLNSQYLPPKTGENTKTKAENPNTISVWCTDKNAWRSFRIDSVSKVVRLS